MDNQETNNLEDNLPMVSYIMLHRIYDMLTLIADIMAKNDDDRQKISKMVEYHKEGFLLGPAPSYNSGENNE
jgi:hypothetical protein